MARRPQRGGGDAAEPDPRRGDDAVARRRGRRPTATLEMSSNRRLAILWKAVIGASGSGIRTARISSSGAPHGLAVAGEVVGERHLALAVGPTRARPTPPGRAARAAASPMGEPVPRLPPSVAPLRISREANCGNSCVQQRHPARRAARSTSERVSAAPISMRVVADGERRAARAAGRRRRRAAARAPRRLTSTPQSVRAGDQPRRPGARPAAPSASARSAGRTNVARRRRQPGGRGGRRGLGRAGRPAGRRRRARPSA